MGESLFLDFRDLEKNVTGVKIKEPRLEPLLKSLWCSAIHYSQLLWLAQLSLYLDLPHVG